MMNVTTGRIYTNGLYYAIRRIDDGGIDIITPDDEILVTNVPSLPEAVQIAQTDAKDAKYNKLRDPYRSNQIMWPEA